MHNAPHKPINEQSLHEGYEVTDMSMRVVLILMAVIGLMMGGACVFIVIHMRASDSLHEYRRDASQISPVYVSSPVVPGYEGPRLQQDPRAERDAYRKEAYKEVNSYAILSEEAGMKRARIPVEEAMKRIASGEAPYKKEPQAALVQ